MSYTTVEALYVEKGAECIEELRNSHGSAPVIWNEMCKKYYGSKDYSYMFDGTLERLWPRWEDLGIPEHQRAVLMMTYDMAYVSSKYYSRAAADIRKFLEDFPPRDGYVNHWNRIAEIFEENPDVPAIGFCMTSVMESLWMGKWNEEIEEYGPIDWEAAIDVYGLLDGLCSPNYERNDAFPNRL